MRIRYASEEKVGFQMAPMIDCVFLLLVYFMCATTFMQSETRLNVNLPSAAAAPSAEALDEVIIDIMNDGGIAVNEKEYDFPTSKDLPQLKFMLSQLVSLFKDQGVIIRTGEEALHGRVVDVLNACAAVNIERISFFAPE